MQQPSAVPGVWRVANPPSIISELRERKQGWALVLSDLFSSHVTGGESEGK